MIYRKAPFLGPLPYRQRKKINNTTVIALVGNLMLRQFHKNTRIVSVKLIFITDPCFPFSALKEAVRETEKITKALDHILKNGMTDCDSCSLQKVCEEVEGMKALHFNMTNHN